MNQRTTTYKIQNPLIDYIDSQVIFLQVRLMKSTKNKEFTLL